MTKETPEYHPPPEERLRREAVAQLLKSNADVTHALVYAVQGETRHRSIVECINGGSPGLNPFFFREPGNPNKGALFELKCRVEWLTAREAEANGIPYVPPEPEDDDDAGDDT